MLQGALAGAVAGLVASWAMESFQAAWSNAGELVHYGFGSMNGALYGALADFLPPIRLGNGMLCGAGLWLVADELMLWKLGLANKPTEFPTATHAYALASHLVYGLTLETVRRAIRWLA